MPLGLPMLDDGRGCQRITDATDLLVPGDSLEIEGPWRGRSCRWRDIRQHQQPVAHRQRRCALAERNAHANRSHLDPRSAVAFQPYGFEDDTLAFGQSLDVGNATFDVDAEQRAGERRCCEGRRTPGRQTETEGRCHQPDRQRPRVTAGRR